jgi:hypothetical protein
VQWQQVLHSVLPCKTLSLKSDAGCPVKYNFFLHDFALILLENLQHFLNLCDNFWLNKIWNTQSVATLNFCGRLAESDVTVTPSVTCMDLSTFVISHSHVISPSTALAFLTNTVRNINLHHLVLPK